MKTASPLRYPGGKAAMASLLTAIRRLNGLGDRAMAEPFAGGAGASIALLYLEEAEHVRVNDADPAVHDFWWTLVNRPQPFLDKLASVRVSLAEWRRQRDVYRSKGRVSRLKRGFAAFYLNRCNRSGIIMNGGPIGGIHQKGKWKLGVRFNKRSLHERCARVAEYRERISVSGEDGLTFIKRTDQALTFFLIDPPYFDKGPTLYLNALDGAYHKALADQLKDMKDAAWVLTYDDCPQVRRMYRGWATIHPFTLRYTAARKRIGKEVMITPKWMRLPSEQASAALRW